MQYCIQNMPSEKAMARMFSDSQDKKGQAEGFMSTHKVEVQSLQKQKAASKIAAKKIVEWLSCFRRNSGAIAGLRRRDY
jgi:hypothetical protein